MQYLQNLNAHKSNAYSDHCELKYSTNTMIVYISIADHEVAK